jgi:hypothetical protein
MRSPQTPNRTRRHAHCLRPREAVPLPEMPAAPVISSVRRHHLSHLRDGVGDPPDCFGQQCLVCGGRDAEIRGKSIGGTRNARHAALVEEVVGHRGIVLEYGARRRPAADEAAAADIGVEGTLRGRQRKAVNLADAVNDEVAASFEACLKRKTLSCGPFRAATVAACAIEQTDVTDWLWMVAMALSSGAGPAA